MQVVMRSLSMLLALAAVGLAVAQAPPPPPWKDPNAQAEGFQASLTAAAILSNPLGLKPAKVQGEGMDAPNAGLTFSSQHNAETSDDAANLWTFEFDGYNVEDVGLTTVHNLKDPKWPVVLTLFDSVSSADFAPISFGEMQKADLDKLAQNLTDASGKKLGYKEIFAAINANALGVVARMAKDPSQAIFGILGNDVGESGLVGGIDMPVDDDTFIPLTEEELAELGIPPAEEESTPPMPDADPAAGATAGTPPAVPISAAPTTHGLPAALLLAAAVAAALAP